MRTFLDTHAWVWWVTKDRRLSARALKAIQQASLRDSAWISAISIWEVAKKAQKGQLVFDRPLRHWLEQATAINGLFIAEISTEVLLESCELPQPFHGDPADQIIVATVRHYGGKLITKDEAIRRYPHVACTW
jgi:PIN domain nuclease of toxin-antitoxin system